MVLAVAACSGASDVETETIDASAMTSPTAFSGDDLARLGFFNTGIVFDAKATFESLVRPGLTAVQVPSELRLPFGDGPWQPDMRPDQRIGFGAKFNHRWYHIEIELRDADGEYLLRGADGSFPLRFEYNADGIIQLHSEGSGSFQVVLSANSSLDSDPWSPFPWPAEQGAWHRVIVDTSGAVWLESRPRAGLGSLITQATGEAITVARLDRIGQVYRGSLYQIKERVSSLSAAYQTRMRDVATCIRRLP